jgi:toxin-antitoxin system PIN domain toxin
MSAVLADANVLIALMIAEHVHHEPAQTWFAGRNADQPMAICPITEGALVRAYLREGLGAAAARADLTSLTADERVRFWPDDLCYSQSDLRAVRGHRQVADAYLASLAAHHGGRLATFDKGLAATYQDLAILLG